MQSFYAYSAQENKRIVTQRTKQDERKKTELIDDIWYRFNMYCMSLLVNVQTLHELDTILDDVVVCLSSKKQTKNLTTAYCRLTGRIHNMENDCNINLADFQKEMKDVKIESDECIADHWGKSCNPFVEYFEKKSSSCGNKCLERYGAIFHCTKR